MANTFTNIHLHIIFAVKCRDAMLDPAWRTELFQYMAGIIKNAGHKPLIVGGYLDHVHILLSANKQMNLPELIKNIKLASNQWIQPKCKCRFQWQSGYGCFSISDSHVKAVTDYIMNQPEHHSKVSMLDEFRRLFVVNGIDFEERYFFKNPE